MSEDKKLIPRLRFKIFKKSEWTPSKLKNIVRFSKGRGYSKNDLLESGSPIILYGKMYTNYETIIHKVDNFVNPKKNSVYSKGTEVIVPSSGETAEDIARASFVSKKGIILGGDLNIMHPIEEHSPLFLALSLSSGDRKKELIKRVQGSSVVHLYNTDLEDTVVYFPQLIEQQKIGSFFKKIDQMIQLQQSKVNKVKAIKAAYLSEMFPKEGEQYPKRRFKGFTEPWGEYSLERIGDIVGGNSWRSNEYNEEGSHLIITIANVSGDYYVDVNEGNRITPNNNRYVLSAGDILISMTGNVGRVSRMPDVKAVLNQRVGKLVINSVIDKEFILTILQNKEFERSMILQGQGAAQLNINRNDILDYRFKIPEYNEQEKIGNFFKNLDNQISIEEEKLAKLEKLKQAYLNDMFV